MGGWHFPLLSAQLLFSLGIGLKVWSATCCLHQPGLSSLPITLEFLPFQVCVEPFQFRANLVREEHDLKPTEVDACAVSHL